MLIQKHSTRKATVNWLADHVMFRSIRHFLRCWGGNIHYLNISSINIGWSNALEFLICPVDSVMQRVHRQTDRPSKRATDQHTSVWAIHSCSFYLSLVPGFWPEHNSERDKYQDQIYITSIKLKQWFSCLVVPTEGSVIIILMMTMIIQTLLVAAERWSEAALDLHPGSPHGLWFWWHHRPVPLHWSGC